MQLIVDIGNTRTKAAIMNGQKIISDYQGPTRLSSLLDFIGSTKINGGIWSSVRSISSELSEWFDSNKIYRFTWKTPIPIKNLYSTPKTLGMDRLAAAVGAWSLYQGRNILVIDAGTAITFDFVSSEGVFMGGNISPGKELRFRSLHEHTDSLPLIQAIGEEPFWGDSTETAIRRGVLEGIRNEVEGYISSLHKSYSDLLVFLTGGDKELLEKQDNKGTFVAENLVIQGLNCIYKYNEEN